VFKDIALGASLGKGVLRAVYEAQLARGKRPSIGRVILARRVAAIVFAMWRSGVPFDASRITIENRASGRASTCPFVLGPA